MIKRLFRFLLFALVTAGPLSPLPAAVKSTARLEYRLHTMQAGDVVAAWVYFVDKGRYEQLRLNVPPGVVSDRSFARRLRAGTLPVPVDYTDLPLEPSYLEEVSRHVATVRHRSKWFNAVSVTASGAQLEELAALPYVASLDLVARSKRGTRGELHEPPPFPPAKEQSAGSNGLDYGTSIFQVRPLRVPEVHATGNYGQGVLVALFDNGFRLLNHEVFDSLDLVATYDFVDHKVDVRPNNPDPSFGSHGVFTLSNIAGFREGQLIGPAFRASYLLARTENDSSETPIEEDAWVAAIEWADSIGVQVTSTSLGYLTYDVPHPSWTWEDMDGNTTVITRAGNMAAAKGIVVLNSAGNNGQHSSRNTLNAPADGFGVVAVGAVNRDGSRAGFSSVGPTVDGRIKPDIMAPGTEIVVASGVNPSGYGVSQGTSHSCPLAAGVVALMLHAKPDATPAQILEALRRTATRATAPDNRYGWGLIRADAAIDYLAGTIIPERYALLQNYPNPFNSRTTIRYQIPEASSVSLKIFDILGREVRTLLDGQTPPLPGNASVVVWDGRNNGGKLVASGVYVYRLTASGMGASGRSFTETRKMVFAR